MIPVFHLLRLALGFRGLLTYRQFGLEDLNDAGFTNMLEGA